MASGRCWNWMPHAMSERAQRFQREELRADVGQRLHRVGRTGQAVNPTVRHVAAHDRQIGLLRQQRIGEILHAAHGDLRVRELLPDRGDPAAHRRGGGRAFVVAAHDHRQPGLVRPIGRRQQAAVVAGRKHRQHARAVRAFPPEDARLLDLDVGRVGAEVEELHPRVMQQRGDDPVVAGHVGHLGVVGQRQAVFAGDARGVDETARQRFDVRRGGFDGVGQRVDDEVAALERLLDALLASRDSGRPRGSSASASRESSRRTARPARRPWRSAPSSPARDRSWSCGIRAPHRAPAPSSRCRNGSSSPGRSASAFVDSCFRAVLSGP